MSDIQIVPSPEELLETAAGAIINLGRDAIRQRGRFALALSGGSTPLPLYEHLASGKPGEGLEWDQTHFFWGDERPVGPDHPDSNYGQATRTLLSPLNIPFRNIHRIQGELQPAVAAERYQQELTQWFEETPPRFDLILLGMGGDGHTASLFPGTQAVRETDSPAEPWVAAVYAPRLESWRITFTPRLIKSARQILFLVTGASKAETLNKVLYGPFQPEKYPAQLFREEARWLLDQAAAARLEDH